MEIIDQWVIYTPLPVRTLSTELKLNENEITFFIRKVKSEKILNVHYLLNNYWIFNWISDSFDLVVKLRTKYQQQRLRWPEVFSNSMLHLLRQATDGEAVIEAYPDRRTSWRFAEWEMSPRPRTCHILIVNPISQIYLIGKSSSNFLGFVLSHLSQSIKVEIRRSFTLLFSQKRQKQTLS